jgi:hypothetical protein
MSAKSPTPHDLKAIDKKILSPYTEVAELSTQRAVSFLERFLTIWVAWIGYDRDGKNIILILMPSLAVSGKAFLMRFG